MAEERRWQSRPRPERAARGASGWVQVGAAVSLVALTLLVLDMAVETWQSGSPFRGRVAVATAVYVLAAIWALSQGARPAVRGWLVQPAAPVLLILGLLVATSGTRNGITHGVTLLRQPTPAVLLATMLALVVLAGFRLVTSRLSIWVRLVLGAASIYAAAALVMAIRSHTPLTDLLKGHSYWEELPTWLRGGFLGAWVLLPLALAAEILTAMAHLVLGMRFWWILIFGLGLWIAINSFSV